MDIPKDATIGECYRPAMEITTVDDAAAYFEALVQRSILWGNERPEAEQIERHNLGYFAGYYDNATRERVERLFHCAHPIFGAIAVFGPPKPEEAFSMGQRMARSGD